MSRKPSQALLKDLKTVFAKHAWNGAAVGVRALEDSPVDCAPPKSLHSVTYQNEDGDLINKTLCF